MGQESVKTSQTESPSVGIWGLGRSEPSREFEQAHVAWAQSAWDKYRVAAGGAREANQN